jgi:hypothetical protein
VGSCSQSNMVATTQQIQRAACAGLRSAHGENCELWRTACMMSLSTKQRLKHEQQKTLSCGLQRTRMPRRVCEKCPCHEMRLKRLQYSSNQSGLSLLPPVLYSSFALLYKTRHHIHSNNQRISDTHSRIQNENTNKTAQLGRFTQAHTYNLQYTR